MIIFDIFESSWTPHLDLPVVGGGLIELLPQLEGQLCVLDGALGLHRHLVSFRGDDGGGLGHDAHLACGEAHACGGHAVWSVSVQTACSG